MNPLDFLGYLQYNVFVVNDFIGNIIVTILAIIATVMIAYLFVKVLWGVVKFILKPVILVILAIAAFFTFGV